ncbi:MAG: hypothetical protein R6V48_05000 [Fidelibacterota bacterium]
MSSNRRMLPGVMALFGAPLAHEDHAQRACGAALDVQAALLDYSRRVNDEFGVAFKLRIGLNSGPVPGWVGRSRI